MVVDVNAAAGLLGTWLFSGSAVDPITLLCTAEVSWPFTELVHAAEAGFEEMDCDTADDLAELDTVRPVDSGVARAEEVLGFELSTSITSCPAASRNTLRAVPAVPSSLDFAASGIEVPEEDKSSDLIGISVLLNEEVPRSVVFPTSVLSVLLLFSASLLPPEKLTAALA